MDDTTVPARLLTSSLWTLPDPTAAPSSPDEPPAPPDDHGPNYDRLLLTPQTSRPALVAPEISPTNLGSTMFAENAKRPLDEDMEPGPSLLEHPDAPAPKRPRREINPPSRYSDDQPAWLNGMIRVRNSDNPTLSQAMKGDEWDAVWAPAVCAKMEGLEDRNTGTVVEPHEVPIGEAVYPSKMDLHKKKTSEGYFLKAKARLVLMGNMVKAVLTSIFAPTTNEKSLKILFALAIIFSLTITGVDIKGAFLYPELPPGVTYYMEPSSSHWWLPGHMETQQDTVWPPPQSSCLLR
jgi:hypothetical protein